MHAPDSPDSLPVLVVGAGVAGLTAALDLAALGIPVVLVEREGCLGGQAVRLDKLYPSDHCGFCPVWTDAAACLAHPLITLHRHTSLEGLAEEDGRIMAQLAASPPAVDLDACVFCGLCLDACEARGVPGTIKMRLEGMLSAPDTPPVPYLNPVLCSRCGECAGACPTGAIDPLRLDRPPQEVRLPVADVIFATGFTENDTTMVPEYLPDSHPDIFSALDFEAWTSEAGPNAGRIARRSNGKTPRSIGFIQCVGSRDQRFQPYCSSVCCMHALKQARWAKRRLPAASVAIFFTDLRAIGKGYEAYARAAAKEGVLLVRSRPGLVFCLPEEGGGSTPAVHYEDTGSGELITAEFDIVVLNGGLTACPMPGRSGSSTQTGSACGFCEEPADVSRSVVQGSRAAALVAMRLASRTGGGL